MRVLVLSSTSHEPATRELLRSVAVPGCEIVAATPGGTAASDSGVRYVPVPTRGSADEPRTLRWHKGTLRRILSELRPDLVHVDADPDTPLAAAVAAVCERLAIPFVLFSDQSAEPGGLFARRRADRVLQRAAGLIGGNRRAESRLASATAGTLCTTLPRRGVSVPTASPRTQGGELSIGFVGRLAPDRGLDFLLRALAQTYGHWHLTVLGTGPEQEALEALAARHGLAARVRWWGGMQRELLERLWQEIDCLVVPWRPTSSRPDAPLLLDAMARGIAPVVADTEPLPELVGDTGPIVGGVEALTETLQGWVAEPSRAAVSGGRARQRVLSEFVTSVVAARLVEFWRAAVADRKLVTS